MLGRPPRRARGSSSGKSAYGLRNRRAIHIDDFEKTVDYNNQPTRPDFTKKQLSIALGIPILFGESDAWERFQALDDFMTVKTLLRRNSRILSSSGMRGEARFWPIWESGRHSSRGSKRAFAECSQTRDAAEMGGIGVHHTAPSDRAGTGRRLGRTSKKGGSGGYCSSTFAWKI
jgi:hypothetical protein